MQPFLCFRVLLFALLVAPRAGFAQAPNASLSASSSEKTPADFASQNSPCSDQPRSVKELAASFEKGSRPLASEMTGNWVEIGNIIDRPVDVPLRLNCSGVTQQNKLEFVLVASGYSLELHAVGMMGPQRERMKPDDNGGVEFQEVYFGGEVTLENFHCRLSKRGTLVCLIGASQGVEFKKMAAEKDQIFEAQVP